MYRKDLVYISTLMSIRCLIDATAGVALVDFVGTSLTRATFMYILVTGRLSEKDIAGVWLLVRMEHTCLAQEPAWLANVYGGRSNVRHKVEGTNGAMTPAWLCSPRRGHVKDVLTASGGAGEGRRRQPSRWRSFHQQETLRLESTSAPCTE